MTMRSSRVVLLALLLASLGSLAFAQAPVTPEIRANVEDGSFLVAHYVDFTIAGRRFESRVFRME